EAGTVRERGRGHRAEPEGKPRRAARPARRLLGRLRRLPRPGTGRAPRREADDGGRVRAPAARPRFPLARAARVAPGRRPPRGPPQPGFAAGAGPCARLPARARTPRLRGLHARVLQPRGGDPRVLPRVPAPRPRASPGARAPRARPPPPEARPRS